MLGRHSGLSGCSLTISGDRRINWLIRWHSNESFLALLDLLQRGWRGHGRGERFQRVGRACRSARPDSRENQLGVAG
jgi:hypothetical protein